jgi:hypothetical protein
MCSQSHRHEHLVLPFLYSRNHSCLDAPLSSSPHIVHVPLFRRFPISFMFLFFIPLPHLTVLFIENNYPYIKTPIFPLNSMYDIWQLECIATATISPEACNAFPAWSTCFTWGASPSVCSPQEVYIYIDILVYFL